MLLTLYASSFNVDASARRKLVRPLVLRAVSPKGRACRAPMGRAVSLNNTRAAR